MSPRDGGLLATAKLIGRRSQGPQPDATPSDAAYVVSMTCDVSRARVPAGQSARAEVGEPQRAEPDLADSEGVAAADVATRVLGPGLLRGRAPQDHAMQGELQEAHPVICPPPCPPIAPSTPGCAPAARRRPGRGRRQVEGRSPQHRLPDELFELLIRHREQQEAERQHARSEWHDSRRIFTQPNDKASDPRRDYAERHELSEAGVPEARLHDARHTAAAVLPSSASPTASSWT